jgi:capsular polysaccharide biosynthesis protein
MEPTELALTGLRRRWWVVALTAIGALLVVLAIDLLATPQYRAEARFLIAPVKMEDPGDLVDSTVALDRPTLAATFAEVFSSPTLQRLAANRATAGALSPEDLEQYNFSAVVLPETSVLLLSVTGPDANLAASLANALGEEAVAYLQPFAAIYQVRELDRALAPDAPYSPQLLADLAVALAVGVAVGVVLALGLSYLSALARLPDSNRQPVPSAHSAPPTTRGAAPTPVSQRVPTDATGRTGAQ